MAGMSIVPQALARAGDARFHGEVQMDQRKPAAPVPAQEMSRQGEADRAAAGQGEAPKGSPSVPVPAVEQLISRQLRAIYDEVVNEPVPDRFVKLLEELERKRGGA
jgi:hypothetical protein